MSKNKQLKKEQYWTTFDQIKGYGVEVKRLKAVAAAMKNSADYRVFPNGIMLSGSPGTGKTTLAKAFISETGFPCYTLESCPNEKSVMSIYDAASRNVPSIVFLDDVDRIVATTGPDGYISDESRACLKELLSRLDGVGAAPGVVTVMTTNEYYSLDDAMKRSGRVDLHIPIARPNDEDRKEIIGYYMSKYGDSFPDPDGKLAEAIAKKCHDMSCADLQLVVKDVYLLNYSDIVGGEEVDILTAFQSRIMELTSGGLLKRICKNDEDVMRICYHESGHALTDWVLNGKASDICCLQVSDNGTGGWTAPRLDDADSKMLCLDNCENEIAVFMAGLVAEKLLTGRISAGALSDMDEVTKMVKLILATCMGGFGSIKYLPCALPTFDYMDNKVQGQEYIKMLHLTEIGYIEDAFDVAQNVINAHIDALKELAVQLKERGVMSAEAVSETLVQHGVPKKDDRKKYVETERYKEEPYDP